jgi:CTP synthase (UTP-ammonia lyase)
MKTLSDPSIALVGDFNASVPAHRSIPQLLSACARDAKREARIAWLDTGKVHECDLGRFAGFWCVPASPYRSAEGALQAIQFAREQHVPFLGTCGGFQHAILEYARNVLDISDADHLEDNPEAATPVITPLACSLVEAEEIIRPIAGTRFAGICTAAERRETYHCRFGVNPGYREKLFAGDLAICAVGNDDEVRACELRGHPFFFLTLFQPERWGDAVHPLIREFFDSALSGR